MLCDLRLGLSLSGLLYNKRALDSDILTPTPPKHQLLVLVMGAGVWTASLP